MKALLSALLFLGLFTGIALADHPAATITVFPPPPSISDWHNGNRHWNLDGARTITIPGPAHDDHGHGHGYGHHQGYYPYHSYSYSPYGYGYEGYGGYGGYGYSSGYSNYGYSQYSGGGYYNPLFGLSSMVYSTQDLAAALRAQNAFGQGVPRGFNPPRQAVRRSSVQARTRARQLQRQGDEHFAEQNYSRAHDLYKSARRAAPERSEVHFRIAQVFVALGKYAKAVTEIQRGLRADPNWTQSDFDLNDLYGEGGKVEMLSHMERLALQLRENLDHPDLLFLLGYHLYFTGDRERAIPFFQRALQLGSDPDFLTPFLEPAQENFPMPQDDDEALDESPAPARIELPRNGERREI